MTETFLQFTQTRRVPSSRSMELPFQVCLLPEPPTKNTFHRPRFLVSPRAIQRSSPISVFISRALVRRDLRVIPDLRDLRALRVRRVTPVQPAKQVRQAKRDRPVTQVRRAIRVPRVIRVRQAKRDRPVTLDLLAKQVQQVTQVQLVGQARKAKRVGPVLQALPLHSQVRRARSCLPTNRALQQALFLRLILLQDPRAKSTSRASSPSMESSIRLH